MKRSIIFLILGFFFFISCKKVLTEKPKLISEENFYKTPDEVQSAINGIYGPLKSNLFDFTYPAQLVCYTDFAEGRGSYAPISQFSGLDNTNIGRIEAFWRQLYQSIRNANNVINNVKNNENLPDATKRELLGEVLFLRAFDYFHITRNWGKAVLRTEDNMLEPDVPLSESSDVYKLIEDDLKFAIENLPPTTDNAGHPTSGSAKTLLADVYFYQGKYEDALKFSKEVKESNQYSLVKIATYQDFEYDLYGPDLVTSPEEIFYIKFSRSPGDAGWAYPAFLSIPISGYYGSGLSLYAIVMDTSRYNVYVNWDTRDIRRQLWFGQGDLGFGPNYILSRKFIDPSTLTSGTYGGNDYPFYRYADLLLIYAESEARVNGVNSNAIEALNTVKRRGYGRDPLQSSDIDYKLADFADLDDFIDTVLNERGYENSMEGVKRWFDLKRLGRNKAKEIILAHTGKVIEDRHFLWPFPTAEFDNNGALEQSRDQNPGY